MAVLALMVSAAAIAVNSYLVRSHEELAARNVPALELASRSLAEADAFGSLAAGFAEADTPGSLDQLTAALLKSVDALETDIAELEQLRVAAGITAPVVARQDTPALRDVVVSISRDAHDSMQLEHQLAQRATAIAQASENMKSLTESEGDLARLRITAGIADIYSDPETQLLERLDTLADRYLFAYDRLTELIHATVQIDLELQHIPNIATVADIQAAQQRIEAAMSLFDRRIPYLPTELGRRTAQSLVNLQRAELGAGGVVDLRQRQILLETQIGLGQMALRERVSALAEHARRTSAAVQRASMAEIARPDRFARQVSSAFMVLAVLVLLIEGLAWVYARRELVGRLVEVARNIVSVARGNHDTPIAITGHDEIGRMEKSLNILRRRAGEGPGCAAIWNRP